MQAIPDVDHGLSGNINISSERGIWTAFLQATIGFFLLFLIWRHLASDGGILREACTVKTGSGFSTSRSPTGNMMGRNDCMLLFGPFLRHLECRLFDSCVMPLAGPGSPSYTPVCMTCEGLRQRIRRGDEGSARRWTWSWRPTGCSIGEGNTLTNEPERLIRLGSTNMNSTYHHHHNNINTSDNPRSYE